MQRIILFNLKKYNNKFEKIIIDNVDNIIEELYYDLFKYNIEDIKNIDFIEFVQDKLSSHNIKFKITPPQLLDSNSTTGKSVNIKSDLNKARCFLAPSRSHSFA